MRSPRWDGGELRGRTILLHAEQGLGDTLQFIRFATLVKKRGPRVLVACPEPLMRIVSRCAGVDHVVDWKSTLPESDVHAPLLSLPAILGTSIATLPAEVPYLSADAETIETWRPVVTRALALAGDATNDDSDPARTFKVGIAWQGNRVNSVDRWRSFPLLHFGRLAEVPGVRLISLQKGEGTEQLAGLSGQFRVANLNGEDGGKEDCRDFLDTAAVMSQVDLVVTPETAVAHLAGSLGVPVWVVLSAVGDWRWMLDRDDSPWYPSMRLFRQTTPGDWDGVFERMACTLRHELASLKS
jgi:hypothetical protein